MASDPAGPETPADRDHHLHLSARWAAVAAVIPVVVIAVALVVLATRPTSYACTFMGGPIIDVATADEAFDAWWQADGPREAARLTALFPATPTAAPDKSAFERLEGSDDTAAWVWDFADGQRVSVTVGRVATDEGWMVAANRCSS